MMKYLLCAIALCFLCSACGAHNGNYDLCTIGIDKSETAKLEPMANEAGWDAEQHKPGWLRTKILTFREWRDFKREYNKDHADEWAETDAKFEVSVSFGKKTKKVSKKKKARRKRREARKERRAERRQRRRDRRAAFNDHMTAKFSDPDEPDHACQLSPLDTRIDDDRIEVTHTGDPERPLQAIVIFNDRRVATANPKIREGESEENYRFRLFHELMKNLLYYFPDADFILSTSNYGELPFQALL